MDVATKVKVLGAAVPTAARCWTGAPERIRDGGHPPAPLMTWVMNVAPVVT